MTRLALCLLLLATGASAGDLPPNVWSFEDKTRGVVCYVLNDDRLSCVKVWLPKVAGNERQPSRTKKIQDLHPHWRLGAGLMRGISCEPDIYCVGARRGRRNAGPA